MLDHDLVLPGHGSGGELFNRLLKEIILPIFHDVQPADGAVLAARGGRLPVFTADSYVIKPLFFPGGDIGKIAVNGTVNDLAMMGAEPAYLSCGFIIEEGFKLSDFQRICISMREAAREAGISIVTGDTKVMGRGEADGIYIGASGIGFAAAEYGLSPDEVRPGDCLVINGSIGDHGAAVLAARLGDPFRAGLLSDSAPLWMPVYALISAGIIPRVMRDITGGGLAGIVKELAAGQKVDYMIDEKSVQVDPGVTKACAIQGFDPYHMACGGRFIAVVEGKDAKRARDVLRGVKESAQAEVIGMVREGTGRALLQTADGGMKDLDPPSGKMPPRIC
ncbi:MAG: hydrogenase expression/formation protein HypE [Bacillota bacterium]